ncbi:MFS general substrate transporter [Bimuria novae-zelandiae CBS 107.79]|uniref:MFS general substrate transporter n=1 Tax=Bimuria novae-zelandiae CBS 107.79 TaxID=1447943 RepID=A0A6A5UUG5_9PLEO|nr:MFS general substrate transporter [Bimuria novae-zelandiae CBS 107.79]
MSGKFTLKDAHFVSGTRNLPPVDIADSPEIRRQSVRSPSRSSEIEQEEEDAFLGQGSTVHAQVKGKPGLDDDNEHHRPPRDLIIHTNAEAGTGLPQIDETQQSEAAKEKPVTWLSLPRKDQLAVLTLARLSEPLTQTSLGSYIFYQLKSFNPTLPDSTISYQAGILHAAFPGAQFLTAIAWGRFADAEYGGRKRTISIGLLGTMVCFIGYGFSRSFAMALFFRCLGGVLNGNIGVMRTMISEIIKEKKYQSRAFLLMPMTFNIGVIVGPILGGMLADPVKSYPSVFGPDSLLGGKDGVQWMINSPYALPNLVNAVFLLAATLGTFLFLEETNELCKDKPDPGLRLGRWIQSRLLRRKSAEDHAYTAIPGDEFTAASAIEMQPTLTSVQPDTPSRRTKEIVSGRPRLPFRRIWTRKVLITLLSHGLMACHVGTFNPLWFTFLSAPRYDPKHPYPPGFKPHGFFHFTGGMALPPPRIGLALAILGVIGITLQLFLYPRLSARLDTARSYRTFLLLFPFAYILSPFLSLVPSTSKPPAGVSGALIWIAITGVLFVQVLARTFALPCTAILLNNCCPHPSVLGTVHGVGQSVSSFTRTFGPIVFGWLFGKGLDIGVVALGWWSLACVAVVGSIAAQFVREGDGHEILLEGEVRGKDGTIQYTY